MLKSLGLTMMVCLAAGSMLAAGCNREEPPETVAAPQAETMPMRMEHAMDSGMEDMSHDMGMMDHVNMAAATDNGAVLFQQHCAVCHPGGRNIITPEKTLDRQTLANNGITTVKDIVAIVRKPGPGMTTFGPEVLSDKEAGQVAEHILTTY